MRRIATMLLLALVFALIVTSCGETTEEVFDT